MQKKKSSSGSIGMGVTHYTRNNKEIVRVKHSSINKETENMKANRSQFGRRQAILTRFSNAYRLGFDQLRQPGQTGYNAGVSFNTAHAVTDGVVDLSMMQLSQGPLPEVKIKRCTFVGGKLRVEWESDSSNSDDLVVVTIAKEGMGIMPRTFTSDDITRKSGCFEHSLDQYWSDDNLFVYLFAYRKESNTCSNTSMSKIVR